MKFINFYSQNFEDVMLERCFADIDHGYYIDVGAQHEEYDSVTKYFYDKGWSGINIEPLPEWCQSFTRRERDIVIQCAAGSENKMVKINAVPNTGLSSLSPINTKCIEEAGMQLEERQIQVKTLNSILESLEIKKKRFEFLKIDVEGFELEVFKGVDLFLYRPKIILCEVTQPNSKKFVEEYEEICKVVEMQGYQKVYFDGLNQWWAEETVKNDMAKHFILPPTVFDSTLISPASSTNARKELNQARNHLRHLQIRQEELLIKNSDLLQQIKEEISEKSGILQQLEQEREKKSKLLQQLEQEREKKSKLLQQLEQERAEKSELIRRLGEIYSSRKWKIAELIGKLNIRSWRIKK